MAANQNTNNVPNIQTNSKQTPVNSSHIHSQSLGQMSQFMRTNSSRYQASPIVHWGNQYNSNANMNIFYQNNMRHAVNPSGNVAPYQQNESQIQKLKQSQPQPTPQQTKNKNNPKNNKNRGSHTRDSSLSMSYIQQRQQAFFSDNPPEPISDSDDEIYGDMYKDGLGANNINVKPLKSHKNKKKAKKKANKSRKETEDVWCCSICTYQNNMLLGYCELCGCKKSETPNIVKRVVYPDNNEHKHKESNNSPSPPPQQPPKDDIGLFDLTNNNNKQQQIPDLLSLPPPQEEHNHTQPKKNKPKIPIPRRQQLQKHRSTQSEPNVLEVAKYWQCGVCTFGENPIERPVCKLCGAIPPERPPSPNPPFSIDPKQIKHDEHLLDALPNSHPNGINNKILDLSDLNEETDPLGHQKSASITELPMIDESILHKEKTPPMQAQAPNVYDFGFNNNKLSAQMQAKSNKTEAVLSNLSKLMVDGQATGGVVFPNAGKSAQNIRELHVQPQPYEIPDLPAEKMEAMQAKRQPNQPTIADLGVDLNAQSSSGNVGGGGSGSGIGGWFGKVYNGVRRRAQSNEMNVNPADNTLSPAGTVSSARSRSKSPRGLRKIAEETGRQHSSKRNISVATMPKKQQQKIAKRLNGLHSKKELLRELDSSQQKLQKKLKQHANKVMQLKSEIAVLEAAKLGELKRWNAWYVLELADIAKEFYSHKLSQINHQIELEKLHIECFTEKLQRLENANKNIRKNNKKWNVDDIRNNIEVAFHTAWRIRLSQDVPDKQDYVKQLRQLTLNLQTVYERKRATLGKAVIAVEERKEQVFLFLQSVLAKYESTQMIENKQFKLSRNLDADDSFFAPFDEADQNVFDSFILDQRTKEGRIVSRWLIFIRKKHADITFEDLSDFMQKLAHTLLHSYSLQTKQYYECVRILCFRCILRRRVIKKIIYELLQGGNGRRENPEVVNLRQMIALDGIYQKKVMWMRALNETQLGIKADYWTPQKAVRLPAMAVDHSLHLPGHQKVSAQNGRRSSQIALLAGRDIPFAESINLMGQLEIEQQVVDEYQESLRVLAVSAAQSVRPKRSLFAARSNAKQSLEEERKRNEELSEYNNILPFILPQTALQTLLAATKSIYNNAIKYYYVHYPDKIDDENDDGVFVSQDDLFPIILYCVIQSKVETPHRLIHFVEHILPRDKTTMGQSAFALSALKAAVEYISQAKPPTFGMDAEIELD